MVLVDGISSPSHPPILHLLVAKIEVCVGLTYLLGRPKQFLQSFLWKIHLKKPTPSFYHLVAFIRKID